MTISLSAIHIFPVKALGGIALTQAIVTPRGLQNDRRFMVVDGNDDLVTQREYPKMATVWVEIDDDEVIFSAPDVESIAFPASFRQLPTRTVRVWSSHVPAHSVTPESDRWLSDYLGANVRLTTLADVEVRST